MFQRRLTMKKFACLATLGLIALLVASPAPAAAGSFGIGGIGRIGIGPIGNMNIGRPWALLTDGPYWSRPAFRGDWRQSYSYPNTVYYPQDQAADVVMLRIHVPSDARLWIEGEATSQSGPDRVCVSPSLFPGREYIYHFRVQWDENGKIVERTREVSVHAGDRITVTIDK
jgi:uncharacterized protein (TIGR03000 family)